jgi:hypothetical protein
MKRAAFFLLSFAVIMSPASGQGYIISTFAGSAPPPTPAIGLELAIGEVTGLVPDPYVPLYSIARDSVFRLDRDGTATLVADDRPGTTGDGGPAVNAALGQLLSLATDASGNLYNSNTYSYLE